MEIKSLKIKCKWRKVKYKFNCKLTFSTISKCQTKVSTKWAQTECNSNFSSSTRNIMTVFLCSLIIFVSFIWIQLIARARGQVENVYSRKKSYSDFLVNTDRLLYLLFIYSLFEWDRLWASYLGSIIHIFCFCWSNKMLTVQDLWFIIWLIYSCWIMFIYTNIFIPAFASSEVLTFNKNIINK